MSFSKKQRLKNKDIQLLLKKSKKVNTDKFILYTGKNEFDFWRVAVSLSKKTLKLSSKRNLLRRRIKASLVQAQKELFLDGGYDILVVVRVQRILSYESIKRDIFDLLRKIK